MKFIKYLAEVRNSKSYRLGFHMIISSFTIIRIYYVKAYIKTHINCENWNASQMACLFNEVAEEILLQSSHNTFTS